MLVPLEGYREAWQQVKRESLSHSTYRVVVFVSCLDVDAFAAAVMLSALLKKHLILYKTEPVCGYESLKAGFSRLDPSIRNVFFLGCGAAVDLEELLELDDNDGGSSGSSGSAPRIHVFDRARPWNLNNLFGSDAVYCYEDGNAEDIDPYRAAYAFLADDADGGTISDDGDTDDGTDDDDGKPKRKRRAISDDDDDDDDDDGTQGDDDDDGTQEDEAQEDGTQEDEEQLRDVSVLRQQKRRKTQRRAERAAHVRVLEEYYRQGAHIVSTNAVQVYTLLTLIGETTPQMLWLAVVGLTAIEVQNPQLYRLLIPSLRDEMRRFNQVAAGAGSSGSSTGGSGSSSTTIRFHSEPDFSLFLLRQWSLYESMIHSSYVSAKLFLWREDGRKKLHKMLARVGITLSDARESWVHTKPQLKRELKTRLDSVSGSYGIEGITREGVVRHFGLAGTMSAGDCVESIAAVLESAASATSVSASAAMSASAASASAASASDSAAAAASDSGASDSGAPSSASADAADNSLWVRNFWAAWDSMSKFERLRAGCEQAKLLQQAVVATANFVFEKNLPKDLRSFRMVIVQEAPQIELFFNPLSLQRLAAWVSEGCAEIHSSSTPFVLAVLNEARDQYLVIGMADHRSRGQDDDNVLLPTAYNRFGRQFQETARAINAEVRIDAFESSIIEVLRADLPRFLEALDTRITSELVAEAAAAAA